MPSYYSAQLGWDQREFYTLNRVIARMFRQRDKRGAEIGSIDLNRTTRTTRVIMKCVIESTRPNEIYNSFPNLAPLKDEQPLETPLVLSDQPLGYYPVYASMNVIL
jgi:hypothetical protein